MIGYHNDFKLMAKPLTFVASGREAASYNAMLANNASLSLARSKNNVI